MRFNNICTYLLLILIVCVLTGCGGTESEANIPENAALIMTGRVETQMVWTEDDLNKFNIIEVEFTDSEGMTKVYSGVPLANLLEVCGVLTEAKTLQFVKYDGSTAKVSILELEACENCIVSLEHEGKKPGLTILLPFVEGKPKLIGINEITLN